MTKKILSKSFMKEWREFVNVHPNGNFFQTPEFVDFINSAPNYKADVISHIDKNNIKGILVYSEQKEGSGIKGYFTNRCIVWGGPLVLNEGKEDEIIGSLLKKLKEQTGAIYIEFRNIFDTSSLKNTFESCNYSYQPHLNYIITLKNEKTVWNSIKNEKKRQIRKAFKNGARIEKAINEDDVRIFYGILLKIYKTKINKPLPRLQFFLALFHTQNTELLLVKSNDEIIGGAFLVYFDRKYVYDWFRIGLDKEYKHLYPSTLAVWAGFKYGLDNKIGMFDFMGAGKADEDYGVREFKSQFGGELVEYGRYLFINKPLLYNVGKFGLWLYKMIT